MFDRSTLIYSAGKLRTDKRGKEPVSEWKKERGSKGEEGEEGVKCCVTIWTEKTHIIAESRHIELDLLRDPSAPREINLIAWFD